ncbi:hypothetical protein DC3_05070 [Deinococcus cellulosilyticus NBRC 106333 = KACC 11606]|uniref:Uncharacterized protein n=2 Tax=Deinococcus cellulosilyticus TaxID=401558 RepID=A0A511MWB7_DEIC1|nr:hypothetical protein DC3_05070 [Deinococcus cellulosilyticus NBRC 106333 = KACC 11606]
MALDIAQKTPFQPLLGLGNTGMILGQIRYIDTERIARAYLLEENINEELVDWEKKPSESGIEALGVLYITTKTASGQNLTRFFKYNTDRAHNFFLDKTVAGGLVYAIILSIIIFYPIVYFRRLKHDLLYLVYFLWTVATFAFYMFWFPFLQTEPIFMIVVAIGWAKMQKTKEARIHLLDSTGNQKIASEGPQNE